MLELSIIIMLQGTDFFVILETFLMLAQYGNYKEMILCCSVSGDVVCVINQVLHTVLEAMLFNDLKIFGQTLYTFNSQINCEVFISRSKECTYGGWE